MIVVIIIVVAVLLVAVAGALVLTRRRAHPRVAGEPPAPVAEKPAVDPAAETVPTPTVEELEALLEAPAAPEPVIEAPAEQEVLEKPRLRDRLGRTRNAFTGAFSRMRGRKIDDETWDELEEALLLADVGLPTTGKLLDAVRTRAKETSATEPDELISLVPDQILPLLAQGPA